MVQSAGEVVSRAIQLTTGNPTVESLDELIQVFSEVSWLAADAESLAERAEMGRKQVQATAYVKRKMEDPKATAAFVEAQVTMDTRTAIETEVDARSKARRLKALLESLEQSINAIKFLGRMDGGVRYG